MDSLDQSLLEELSVIRDQGLYRQLRPVASPQAAVIELEGRPRVNFSSNDYLGLANDPALKEAATNALEQYGVGSGASRLMSGSLAPHQHLEEALADFKGTESALAFSSGYATAIGVITALLGKGDFIVLDKRVHACVIDAARLSGATIRVFPHNDLDRLEHILKWIDARALGGDVPGSSRRRRRLVVTESVFSMDGDLAPLREIVELKDRYGAWLMLDEAHATGLFGENRRGLSEAFEVEERIELHMGTLGKALGSSGGYVAGSKILIEFLINCARSFIYSTAPLPVASAIAREGIRIVKSGEGERRRQRLWSLVEHVKTVLIEDGWALAPVQSPIIPLVVHEESKAVALAADLLKHDIFVPAIRFPTVARGAARLRFSISSAHILEHIGALRDALGILGRSADSVRTKL